MTPISVYHYSYLPLSETFIYNQLVGLRRRFDVQLFSLTKENTHLFSGISPIVIPRKSILERFSSEYRSTAFTPSRRRFIVNLIRGTRLLHVNFGHMALSVQDFAEEAGIPLTCMFHGVDASALLCDKNYVAEFAKCKFHTVFTVSEDMKKRLQPFLPHTTHLKATHLGVPVDQFAFKQRRAVPKGCRFLQISRLDYKKGVDISLDVFHRYVREVDSSAKFLIAGDGPLREQLLQVVEKRNLSQQVTFLGKIDQKKVIELLYSVDVFLQHSVVAPDGDMEGIPIILMEAMACGLPVVSTFHSGIPELVENGVNGLLVKEKDTDAYFNALVSLSKIDITSLSQQARQTVEEHFNSARNNEQLCNYIEEICRSV